jgi:hypothetical protein
MLSLIDGAPFMYIRLNIVLLFTLLPSSQNSPPSVHSEKNVSQPVSFF